MIDYPILHVRGGTSTGLILWEKMVPADLSLREELLRHLMGVPLSGSRLGNRQTTGLGRGPATSNKIFLADIEITATGPQIVSTLAQLASDHAAIDWSVNCGNMSSALQMWALDSGLVDTDGTPGQHEINIRNTNTGVITRSRMTREPDGRFVETEIPGVLGAYPAVDLFLQNPVGSKTGKLLPTGAPRDTITGIVVSCVDVAVPMVIVAATDLGKTAHEPIAELEADAPFMAMLRRLWVEAGLKMALTRRDGERMSADELGRSETIPKICIVGDAEAGGNLAVRYFTPQTGHASMAVSGGCCLAAATLIPGTVAYDIARNVAQPSADFADFAVGIENPAGILDTTIVARIKEGMPVIASAAYRRSAQVLVRGKMPLYRASQGLIQALSGHRAAPD